MGVPPCRPPPTNAGTSTSTPCSAPSAPCGGTCTTRTCGCRRLLAWRSSGWRPPASATAGPLPAPRGPSRGTSTSAASWPEPRGCSRLLPGSAAVLAAPADPGRGVPRSPGRPPCARARAAGPAALAGPRSPASFRTGWRRRRRWPSWGSLRTGCPTRRSGARRRSPTPRGCWRRSPPGGSRASPGTAAVPATPRPARRGATRGRNRPPRKSPRAAGTAAVPGRSRPPPPRQVVYSAFSRT